MCVGGQWSLLISSSNVIQQSASESVLFGFSFCCFFGFLFSSSSYHPKRGEDTKEKINGRTERPRRPQNFPNYQKNIRQPVSIF